jgi:methylphosphotriester-DNA--protein-cysteine methyltransferase
MGYFENLQKAVDYIYFHRVFSAVAGRSASEYLRRRRLSRAMVELMTTRGGSAPIPPLVKGTDY